MKRSASTTTSRRARAMDAPPASSSLTAACLRRICLTAVKSLQAPQRHSSPRCCVCVCMCVCARACCLSVCLPACLPVCLSVSLCACMFVQYMICSRTPLSTGFGSEICRLLVVTCLDYLQCTLVLRVCKFNHLRSIYVCIVCVCMYVCMYACMHGSMHVFPCEGPLKPFCVHI